MLQGEGKGIETCGRCDSSNPESLLSNLAEKKIQEVDSGHTRNWFKSRRQIGPSVEKKKKAVSFHHAHWEYSIIALIHLCCWFFLNTFRSSFAFSFRDICTKGSIFSQNSCPMKCL